MKVEGVRNTISTRLFSVRRENAGFLGLGSEIVEKEIIVEGSQDGPGVIGEKILRSAVLYGDGLHAVRLHTDAQKEVIMGADPKILEETGKRLPKQFRVPIEGSKTGL